MTLSVDRLHSEFLVRKALRGKQLDMYGYRNIVNVSADVSSTISMLQLLPYETATIKVNLKWKLQ